MVYEAWEKSIVQHGQLSGSGVRVSALYTEPNLPAPQFHELSPLLDGNNRDILRTFGALESQQGTRDIERTEHGGRDYDVEFVDSSGYDFAYISSRTTVLRLATTS